MWVDTAGKVGGPSKCFQALPRRPRPAAIDSSPHVSGLWRFSKASMPANGSSDGASSSVAGSGKTVVCL